MGRTFVTEHTNMIMIYNKEENKAVVINRKLSWCGISFPGGHVEPGESFYDAAVREAKEETGLTVRNLEFCGVIHWHNVDNNDKYIVYLYKTSDYEGELTDGTEEGDVFFMDIDDIKNTKENNRIAEYIPVFLDGGISEAYGKYTNDDDTGFDILYF
jgi:8-oxo-dGTP diphosphatase